MAPSTSSASMAACQAMRARSSADSARRRCLRSSRDAPRRPRGVRLAPRAARGGLAPRIIERACQRQALVLQPFLRRAGWARRQGRGGRLPARSAWTPCPARRACRARRARALPVRPGPWHLQRRQAVRQRGMGIVMAGRTAQGLMQPDLRLGLVTWTGQRAILRQPDQEPGWFRGRGVGVQAGCVFVQGTPLQTGRHQGIRRARHAADPRGFRVGLVLAFAREIQAGCQEAWHVPVHEEPQRRVGRPCDAPVAAPLPAIAAARNTPGWHSVRAGRRCARIHAPGWRGRRRPTAAPAAAARATARCACRPRAADAAGCWHCIRCSGRPRPARRAHRARTCSISRNSAGASAGVSRPSSGPGGRDEKGRRSIAQPATGRQGQRLGGHAQRAGQRRIQPQRRRAQRQSAPASAASPSSSRDDSFHPDRPGRAMPTARPAWAAGLGADAASAHVGAEHRADGLDQAVRIQHLRLDLVDAFVVRLQPAGVLRPFDGGEAILPGAAPVRVGQRDLALARAARQS